MLIKVCFDKISKAGLLLALDGPPEVTPTSAKLSIDGFRFRLPFPVPEVPGFFGQSINSFVNLV